MKIDIKAPENLKLKTLSRMKKELNNNTKRTPFRVVLIVTCISVFLTFTAFAYSMFSGINGDNVSLNAMYVGNGTVKIVVENLADKDLKFDKTVKLVRWSNTEEILKIEQEMPLIKPNEKKIITITIPKKYLNLLETPISDTDWYYFILTTNNFIFGFDWMASLNFVDPIITQKPEIITPTIVPIEDNTNQDDVDLIKNNFTLQNPLSKLEITYSYNDYKQCSEYIHAEIDLAAELGTSIYPLSSGTVTEADFDEKLGNYIVIDHGNGLLSKYTHCQDLLMKNGDAASMDDIIATVGKTGMATGPHLGFSIFLNNIPINPEALLKN